MLRAEEMKLHSARGQRRYSPILQHPSSACSYPDSSAIQTISYALSCSSPSMLMPLFPQPLPVIRLIFSRAIPRSGADGRDMPFCSLSHPLPTKISFARRPFLLCRPFPTKIMRARRPPRKCCSVALSDRMPVREMLIPI